MEKNINKKIKEHLLILLCFTALTFVFTYPVITQVTTHAAGVGGDGFMYKWNIWHVQKTLTEGGGIKDLYYTDYQFYPEGVSLVFHSLSLTNTLFLASPLLLITDNLVLVYNILFFLTFILAGYGMYLLVYYLVKNKMVAFLAGFAYAFSPIHTIWGLGYLNLMSIQWTPFFLLFFFKIFEEKKISNAIIAALFLFFLTLSDWHHFLFATLIAGCYFLYKVFTEHRVFNRYLVIKMVVFCFLFGVLILPFVLPLINQYGYQARPLISVITPLSYILPSENHSLWGANIKEYHPFSGKFAGGEYIVFPGYLVLFLSLFYVIKTRRNIFWVLLAGIFFFFSLVPHLETPSFFINRLPLFDSFHHMGRFGFGVTFSLIVLFSFALTHFLIRFHKKTRIVLFSIVFAVLALEYSVVPYHLTSDHPHRKIETEFAQTIGEIFKKQNRLKKDDRVFLSLPFLYDINVDSSGLYFQTLHERKMIGGYVSIMSPGSTQTVQELAEIIRASDLGAFHRFLIDNNVGYVIFDDLSRGNSSIRANIIFLLWRTPREIIAERHEGPLEIYLFEVFPEKSTILDNALR